MLRDFRLSDQDALRHLILDGLRERWGDEFDASMNPDLEDLASSYLERGADIVVWEEVGCLVATGLLLQDEGDAGRILRMSVAATHRRRGLGRRIIDELIARARYRKMSEVRVLTDTPWSSAVELYRACGFTELGSDGTDTHFVMSL